MAELLTDAELADARDWPGWDGYSHGYLLFSRLLAHADELRRRLGEAHALLQKIQRDAVTYLESPMTRQSRVAYSVHEDDMKSLRALLAAHGAEVKP